MKRMRSTLPSSESENPSTCQRLLPSTDSNDPVSVALAKGRLDLGEGTRAVTSTKQVVGPQAVQVPGFVFQAPAGEHEQLGILPLGADDLAPSRGQLLLRQVLALEEAGQVGRADDQPPFKKLHLPSTPRSLCGAVATAVCRSLL